VRYMMLITHPETYRMEDVPQSLFAAMDKFVSENQKSGVLVDTAGLQKTDKAVRVRVKNRKVTITDGPFSETKEVVGGYALVEAKSRDHALEIAKQFIELHRIHWPEFDGYCDVRPLETGEPG
jgi:hypothetical protein